MSVTLQARLDDRQIVGNVHMRMLERLKKRDVSVLEYLEALTLLAAEH